APAASSGSRRSSRSSARSSTSSASRPRMEPPTWRARRPDMTEDDDDPPSVDEGADWYGEADPRVPDAPAWPDRDLGFLGDDVFLGEEAVIREGLGAMHTIASPE